MDTSPPWPATLTGRQFPQMAMPLMRPHSVTVEFDHRPSGEPRDVLVLCGPSDDGWSSYSQAGAAFGHGPNDLGYVLELTRAGHVLLRRADGCGRLTLLGIAEASPSDAPTRHRLVRIGARSLTVEGDGIAPMIKFDGTYRGLFLWTVRRLREGVEPGRFMDRTDDEHPALDPCPVEALTVRYRPSS